MLRFFFKLFVCKRRLKQNDTKSLKIKEQKWSRQTQTKRRQSFLEAVEEMSCGILGQKPQRAVRERLGQSDSHLQ